MKEGESIYHKIKKEEKCCSTKRSVNEHGKTFSINCSDKNINICCVKLDKCLITAISNQKQCDYLFMSDRNNSPTDYSYYFVELKGSGCDAEGAFEQIQQAVHYIKSRFGAIPKHQIWGFIVGGKDTQNMSRLKERFKRDIGKELKHSTGIRYEHKI
ncbi:hypothetical protein DR864_10105 [Runella rosea]|uniref:Uncharacterized protein n=1 Tax=Runella rosea TaxID=2259595 RepID=A0A344THE0_9BACT|nr:hypothetical protein [Runella rosea]AXE18061.1 hypothetical protein DR864_10105 [Runella rosea]